MSTKMTKEEREAFLAELHVGVLSINDPGKGPPTVPMWYDYEIGGERVYRRGNRSQGMSFARAAQRAIDLGGTYDGHELPGTLTE